MKSEPGASGRDCAPAFRPPRRNRERSELAGDKGTGGEGVTALAAFCRLCSSGIGRTDGGTDDTVLVRTCTAVGPAGEAHHGHLGLRKCRYFQPYKRAPSGLPIDTNSVLQYGNYA